MSHVSPGEMGQVSVAHDLANWVWFYPFRAPELRQIQTETRVEKRKAGSSGAWRTYWAEPTAQLEKEGYHLIGKYILNAACKHPQYRTIILPVKVKREINDLRLGKMRMMISQNSQEEQHRTYNHSIWKKNSGFSKLDEASCYLICAVHQELQEPCNQLGKFDALM